MKLLLINLSLLALINCVELQAVCTGRYGASMVGKCMEIDSCIGAAVAGNCSQSQTCCVASNESPYIPNENIFLTKNIFLKIAGNTSRNEALYVHLLESMEIAEVQTRFQIAAFVSQLLGETNYFKNIESLQSESDFNTAIGNNQTGDGDAYRGRGAILLRGRTNYMLANQNIPNLPYNLIKEPETAAYPSIAFKIAGWFWKENAYVIKEATIANKGSLNQLADGKFLSFTHLTHALTTTLNSLKMRAEINDKLLAEMGYSTMKRGQGVRCSLSDNSNGYAVPICLLDFKKTYCGCDGKFEIRTCPYGRLANGECRNSALIKCCLENCYTDLDLVILMDSSGSIGLSNFRKEIRFVKSIIENLEINQNASRVSIIRYSNNAEVITHLNTDVTKSKLLKIMDDLEKKYDQGKTYTNKALKLANEVILQEKNGMRPLKAGIPKVLITITDGESTEEEQTIIESIRLKKREINMVSVGVGDAKLKELFELSSTPNDQYYVNNFDEILTIIKEISRTACAQPAEVEEESPIVTKVEKNTYRYFKYPLKPLDDDSGEMVLKDFTIELEELVGSAELYFSFDNNNPKSDSDYIQSEDQPDRNENFIDDLVSRRNRRSVLRAEPSQNAETTTGNKKLYQVSNLNQSRILYFSVMGLMEENSVQVKIYNRTVLPSSSMSNFNGNFIYNILSLVFFSFYYFLIIR